MAHRRANSTGATAATRPKVALPAPDAATMELLGLLLPLPLPVVAELGLVAAGTGAPEVAPEGRGTVPFCGRTVVQPVGNATPDG